MDFFASISNFPSTCFLNSFLNTCKSSAVSALIYYCTLLDLMMVILYVSTIPLLTLGQYVILIHFEIESSST